MKGKAFLVVLTLLIIISLIGLPVSCLAPGEAPTLELEIYDGPDYSESDGMCYFRVQAIATGIPDSQIIFEDEDNINPISSDRVKVGVKPGDSYTLSVTASNSSGSANFSIILKGECDEITTDKEEKVIDEKGAENKEGSEEAPGDEASTEDAPDDEAYIEDTSAEESESGGETEEGDRSGDEPDTVDDGMLAEGAVLLPTGESHYIVTSGAERGSKYESKIIVGDTREDIWITGFLNFSSETIGGTIDRATLHIDNIHETGYASDFGPFIIIASYISEEIGFIPTEGGLTEIHYSDEELRDYIQYIVDNGYEDFNISLTLLGTRYPEGWSNNGVADQFVFQLRDVALTVSHSP